MATPTTPSIFSTAPPECGPPPSSVLLECTWPPRQSQTLPCLGEGQASQATPTTPSIFSSLAASPAPSSTVLAAANPVPQVSSALHPPCRPFPAPAAASVPHVPATPLPALPAPTIQILARVPCPLVAHAAQAPTIPAASQPQTARCVQQAPTPAPTRRRRALGVAWARTTPRLEPIRPQLVCRASQASTETNLL